MKKRSKNKGFSLIELIIAIAILAVLTGMLAPQFMRYIDKSRVAKDEQMLDTIYESVQAALTDEHVYEEVIETGTQTGTLAELASLYDKSDAGATKYFDDELKALLGTDYANKVFSSKAGKATGVTPCVTITLDASNNIKVKVFAGDSSKAEITDITSVGA